MNVEQLRKQAKELAKAARGGDEHALQRLGGREPILARAQLVIAREHGYGSWSRLLAAAAANADAFVLAATGAHRRRAEAMLAARPEIERDAWAGLVLGHGLSGDANTPGGPRGWSPLLYASHSVFTPRELVRDLLERDADPNRRFATEWGETTALYGAAGVVHNGDITRFLLEAGADPNDNESLYHSVEAESPECLRLLLEHGAETRGTNALLHAFDFDRLDPPRLLLQHGADPNEGAYVAGAVRRGRGPDFIRLLAEYGADLDRPGGGRRNDLPLRTGYQHAALRGYDNVAQTLAELGASTDVDPVDRAVAAFARGERPAASVPADLDADQQEVLINAALGRRLEEVLAIVGVDFHGFDGGPPAGTLLHHAAWRGNSDAVGTLLAHGADPVARSEADFPTPAAWAALGSKWWRTPGADYIEVMKLLVAAGAEIEPRFAHVAQGPLEEWLLDASG